ncbi:MAG: hypothetical protein IMZ69_00450, partial [Spirochaetes bacterium]|nr:hypothetical protein [Spirochaetota bacterium]
MSNGDKVKVPDAGRRVLCLTPECQKLWALRPGLCFLYDKIIIDDDDFRDIVESSEDSSYNFLLARNVERLRMEGILEMRSFRSLLPKDVRRKVHDQAEKYVDALPMDRRVLLAAYGHGEFAEYVRGQILFCRDDEPKFSTLSKRLKRVQSRIQTMKAEGRTSAEIDEAMKRTVAKSLAGSYVASEIGQAHLYDTSEYRPFVTGIPIDSKLKKAVTVGPHDSVEDKAVDVVAAILLSKALPDITVYDDHTLTTFMRTREDLARLRSLVEEVVVRYHDLIAADPKTAWSHLKHRFDEAITHIETGLATVAKRAGLLWKLTEILATIKLPVLAPFLGPLYAKNLQIHRQHAIEGLGTQDKFLADLVFVFDEIRFGREAPQVLPKRTFRGAEKSKEMIWGQRGHAVPW